MEASSVSFQAFFEPKIFCSSPAGQPLAFAYSQPTVFTLTTCSFFFNSLTIGAFRSDSIISEAFSTISDSAIFLITVTFTWHGSSVWRMFYFSFSFSFYFFKSVDIELQHLGLMIDEMFKYLWKWNSQKTSKELVIFGSMTISHDVLILKGGYLGIPFAKKRLLSQLEIFELQRIDCWSEQSF